jgi:hypothetical protein
LVDLERGLALSVEEEEQGASVLIKRPDLRSELVFEVLFEHSEHPVRMAPRTDQIETTESPNASTSIWDP